MAPFVIHPTARLGANPMIGAGTVVEERVIVGDDAVLGEFVVLQRQVSAGDDLVAGDFVVVGARADSATTSRSARERESRPEPLSVTR